MPEQISVIVPSRQQGAFLERTLTSIFEQHDPAIEIIVQDGGSTDQSLEILQQYRDRLRWESRPDNGQAAAINTGMRHATGAILGYLNSDDVLYPGALRHVRAFFDAHPAAQVVYGLADFMDADDAVIGPYPVQPWDYARLHETCFISQPACFWRRSLWERAGPLDESLQYTMDYEYWLRVGAITAFHFLPVKLAGTRCHSLAKTFQQRRAVHAETLTMLRRYHAGRVPPCWIARYARYSAAETLGGGLAGLRLRLRFAADYWRHLFALAPQVIPGRGHELLGKLIPPFAAMQRQRRDPFSDLRSATANSAPRQPVAGDRSRSGSPADG